jgi:uncharacterized protein YkwD
MAMLLGLTGCESKVSEQETDAPTPLEQDAAENSGSIGTILSYEVLSNGLTFDLGDYDSPGRTLRIRQGDTEVYVSVPDGDVSLTISEADLPGLTRGEIDWSLESNDAVLVDGTVELTERFTTFYEFVIPDADKVGLNGLPKVTTPGTVASISAVVGATGAKGTVFVGTPDGAVERIELSDGVIASGGGLDFQVSFDRKGIYVVEVLAPAGTPIANEPVYVGAIWPVFSPPLDTLPGADLSGELALEQYRAEMVELINSKRQGAGLPLVTQDTAIDVVSQEKAQLMCDEQYLSHTSKTGQGAGDRLAAAGISGTYRENIAAERGAERVFWTWWWSPSHREPYMQARWTRVGLGAAVYQPGLVAFAQHLME